jgi:hypothetical protein
MMRRTKTVNNADELNNDTNGARNEKPKAVLMIGKQGFRVASATLLNVAEPVGTPTPNLRQMRHISIALFQFFGSHQGDRNYTFFSRGRIPDSKNPGQILSIVEGNSTMFHRHSQSGIRLIQLKVNTL